MRSFLSFVLKVVFIVALPVTLLLAIPRLNHFSISSLEQSLQQHSLYNYVSTALHEQINGNEGDDSLDQFGGVVDELTPEYIQTKTEDLLNQSANWATSKTAAPPVLSFNDLRDRLMAENPAVKTQIDQALADLKDHSTSLSIEGQDAQSQQALQDLLQKSDNLDRLASGDWSVSLAQPLAGLPKLVQYYTIGLPIMGALLLICLIGVTLLGFTLAGKLKSVGWLLLIAGIWNGLLAAVFDFVFLHDQLLNLIPASGSAADIAKAIAHSVQNTVYSQFAVIEGGVSLGLMVIGLLLLVIGSMLKKRAASPVAEPEVIAEQKADSVSKIESLVPPSPKEADVELEDTKVTKDKVA
jgi:hypothetical protein